MGDMSKFGRVYLCNTTPYVPPLPHPNQILILYFYNHTILTSHYYTSPCLLYTILTSYHILLQTHNHYLLLHHIIIFLYTHTHTHTHTHSNHTLFANLNHNISDCIRHIYNTYMTLHDTNVGNTYTHRGLS